ncbi:hypothetical protein PENSPDRAFT_756880 [Peniophora sp. CONT]|nr:hypothetical protein PENSPDRAFT_756880 [Peniophora sp. CONT]
MSLRALLHILLRRFSALIKALRHWDVRTRLRLLLSINVQHVTQKEEPGPRESASIGASSGEEHIAEIYCSVVPLSAAGRQTSMQTATVAPNITEPMNSEVVNRADTSELGHARYPMSERATTVEIQPVSSVASPYLSASPLLRETSRTSDVFPDIPRPRTGRWLRGITPEDLPRYQRPVPIAKRGINHELQPLTTTFPHVVREAKNAVNSLGEWCPLTHPEGSLYFFHPIKRIWTNAYMYERLYHDEVEECAAFLGRSQQVFLDNGSSFPADYETVIEIGTSEYGEDDLHWQYYYVEHATRAVFWLQNHVLSKEVHGVKGGAFSPDHIYHKIQSFYWRHIYHFPGGRHDVASHFGADVWSQLLSFVDFNTLDTILSPRSTSFYSHVELARMKDIVKVARDQSKEYVILPEQLSAAARIQMIIAEQRYLHAHGQPFVRLTINDHIHEEANGRILSSWLSRTLNLLLFLAPSSVIVGLCNVIVDDLVLEYAWREYFKRMLEDWDRLILQGTVVLTANVSFLAIPDVMHFPEQPSGTGGDSLIQTWIRPQFAWSASLSYVSTLLALGSIIAGLFLSRYNRTQIEHSTDAHQASDYLDHRLLVPLAMVYSLPYALLMWGVGFFLAALLCFTFDSTDTATRVVVGVGTLVVTGLLFLLWGVQSGAFISMGSMLGPKDTREKPHFQTVKAQGKGESTATRMSSILVALKRATWRSSRVGSRNRTRASA